MRVCFVTGAASRAAYGVFPIVVGTTQALKRMGHDPHVVAIRDEHTNEDRPLWGEVPVDTFQRLGPRKLSFAPVAPLWFRRHPAFDVVSIQGVWSYFFDGAVRHAQRAGAPLLITPQGMLDPWAYQDKRWRKRVVEWLYVDRMLHAASCFHVNSEGEADAIRKLGLKAPIAIVPNGVELPAMQARGSDDGERVLLFLGRLHRKKGIHELVEAWSAASRSAPGWRLVIAGPDDEGLVDALRQAAHGARVDFVGPVFGAAKRALFERADVFALPSYSEGFPMAVLEAWSYGLPVLKTRACNIPEGFREGAAIEVEPTPESLRGALDRLFSMPREELQDMGRRGRRLVETRYSWDRVARELSAIYEWLRGGKSVPSALYLQ